MGRTSSDSGCWFKTIVYGNTSAGLLMVHNRFTSPRQSAITRYRLARCSYETSASYNHIQSKQFWCSSTTIYAILSASAASTRILFHTAYTTTKAISTTTVTPKLEPLLYSCGFEFVGVHSNDTEHCFCVYATTKAILHNYGVKFFNDI